MVDVIEKETGAFVGVTGFERVDHTAGEAHWCVVLGRGSHSSTFRLNVSTFCGIGWVHDFPLVYETGGHGQV